MADTPLRKLRIMLELQQSDVAEAVGITQSSLSRIESGERARPEAAEALVAFYGPPLTEEHVLFPERFARYLEAKNFAPKRSSTAVTSSESR